MTKSILNLKVFTVLTIALLLALSILLWMNTPDLFEYFNQAFCSH